MPFAKKNKNLSQIMWFISEDTHSAINAGQSFEPSRFKAKKEYRISSLSRYLINPNPIEIQKKLIGYKLIRRKTSLNILKDKLNRWLHPRQPATTSTAQTEEELYFAESQFKGPSLKDASLENYMQKVDELLRAYHPALDTLAKIDPAFLADVSGICTGLDGNQSTLNIKGSVREKLRYLERQLLKDVSVILEKPYISKGLFELEGFDFHDYDPDRTYRLIKCVENGEYVCKIMNEDYKVEFTVKDIKIIEYLFLLELSIQVNPGLNQTFRMFMDKTAIPLRLFFNQEPLIDYTRAPLPALYKTIARNCDIDLKPTPEMIAETLNQLQIGVALSYLAYSDSGLEKIITNISLMHDIKALDTLKEQFPEMYSERAKKTVACEMGRFYLLDRFRGCKNE